MLLEFAEIVLAAICLSGLVILLFRFRALNTWLLNQRHAVPFIPIDEDFTRLLTDIKKLSLEAKLRIIQACVGGELDVSVRIGHSHAVVIGCLRNGEDLNKMAQDDKSIG